MSDLTANSYFMQFSFTPEKIMILMSKDRLKALEQHWTSYEEGLTCQQFI